MDGLPLCPASFFRGAHPAFRGPLPSHSDHRTAGRRGIGVLAPGGTDQHRMAGPDHPRRRPDTVYRASDSRQPCGRDCGELRCRVVPGSLYGCGKIHRIPDHFCSSRTDRPLRLPQPDARALCPHGGGEPARQSVCAVSRPPLSAAVALLLVVEFRVEPGQLVLQRFYAQNASDQLFDRGHLQQPLHGRDGGGFQSPGRSCRPLRQQGNSSARSAGATWSAMSTAPWSTPGPAASKPAPAPPGG